MQHAASGVDYNNVSSADLSSAAFNVLDLDIILSDHLPIMCVFRVESQAVGTVGLKSKLISDDVSYCRQDHAPLYQYYEQTRVLLEPVLAEFAAFDHLVDGPDMSALHVKLEIIYNNVAMALITSANLSIPKIEYTPCPEKRNHSCITSTKVDTVS